MTASFSPRVWRAWALIGVAASAALAVQAQTTGEALSEPSPYGIGLSETLTHESNLFRASDGAEQADWISVTALNFSLDQPLGRQRLRGKAGLQLNRYRENDQLNGSGHDLSLQLDWETVNNLSGLLGVQSTERQYRFGLDSAGPFDGGKNNERTQSAFARAQLGGMGEWSLLAGANVLQRQYSAAAFEANELSQWSAEGGGGYRPSPDLGFTLLLRHTRITRPDVGLLLGDDVGRDDVEAGASWQASGASRFEARLTHSSENHGQAADEAFWTGSLAWHWAPSAKLRFQTKLLRDTEGSNGNIADPEATLPASAAGTQRRDAVQWTAQWAVSPKVSALAGAQWSRRHLHGFGGASGTDPLSATDRTTAFSLGARYQPLRALDLGCDLRNETRDTDTDDLTLTRPYDSLAVGCSLAFWFR